MAAKADVYKRQVCDSVDSGRSPRAERLAGPPCRMMSEVARLRRQFRGEFDPAYVENVIVPHFLVSTYQGERASPVSYTHLDVYKRQLDRFALCTTGI